jgi:hypothetical protein
MGANMTAENKWDSSDPDPIDFHFLVSLSVIFGAVVGIEFYFLIGLGHIPFDVLSDDRMSSFSLFLQISFARRLTRAFSARKQIALFHSGGRSSVG